ncbi:hypothetical protein CBM2609_P370045 [Cupriavidus taiwanensis]|uniref:Uncharacterized protein n=2 Tax=Cupriavidus TaxID=106589 RepID=A0A375CPY3_9BURK|nr:hypothetical protein CBM2589_P380046 [Cupriavidus taiwanensis]SOY78103.1 hypothetical protein CBM2586_P390045 [Cupriavidus taiwanensis]SOZ34114.1 hypothetical protein CBM2609_P370045 [Cupriavidus taiwanensis]SPD62696.1 protein of unknown function [Cupriavidus neocaledonicus]SPD69761.1 protein of unknown function [Cupriavidus taiwanensis]
MYVEAFHDRDSTEQVDTGEHGLPLQQFSVR